ncbi:fluoride efflux transporter CrcB [Nocardioides sp.]|uniref:fluoride efflux transporter CrcB n=1 Tax=Nocardioides sp. TaxID=35761 RepID=UPI0039E5CC27
MSADEQFPGVDPDIDLRVAQERQELDRPAPILVVISLGGILGATARYAASRLWPADGFPWTTLAVNVTGCLLLGVLMAWLANLERPHPLLRPFLGVGILGGYTTFSTFAEETRVLLSDGHAGQALGYVVLSVAGGLAAVLAGRILLAPLPAKEMS